MCEKEWDGFLRLFYYYYYHFFAFVPKCEFSTVCFFQGETNYGDFFFLFMWETEIWRDNYKHFCKVSSNPLMLSFKQPNYWNQQKWQKDLIMYHLVEVKRLQSRALRFTMSSFWRCRNRKMSAWEFCTWKRRDSVDDCDSQVLRSMLGLQVTEEQLQCIAERAIQEADADKDDAISFDEFRKVRTTRLVENINLNIPDNRCFHTQCLEQ